MKSIKSKMNYIYKQKSYFLLIIIKATTIETNSITMITANGSKFGVEVVVTTGGGTTTLPCVPVVGVKLVVVEVVVVEGELFVVEVLVVVEVL